ncbi:MAG: hypothetical protein NTY55_02395 [Flavobacteriia bacterium]|nr:hypothetical protein [Flavobacteriia bacterium]
MKKTFNMDSSNTENSCKCIVVENWFCGTIEPEPVKPKRSPEMQAILKKIPFAINWFRKNPNEHNLGKLNFYSNNDHFELVRAYPGFFGNIKIYKNHISIYSNGYRHAIRNDIIEIENIRFALVIMCNLSIIYKCIYQFNPVTAEQKRTGLEFTLKEFSDYFFFIPYENISNLTEEYRPKVVHVEAPKSYPVITAKVDLSNSVEEDLYY